MSSASRVLMERVYPFQSNRRVDRTERYLAAAVHDRSMALTLCFYDDPGGFEPVLRPWPWLAAQRLSNSFDQAGVLDCISGQLGNRFVKLCAAHDGKHPLYGLVLEGLLPTYEQIVFGHEAHEVEVELPRRGLHPEARIGHAARHIGRDGRMRELDALIPVYARRVDMEPCDQLIEQKPRA